MYDPSSDLTQDGNGNTYAYNLDGSIASASGAPYTYDAMQQRVEKTGSNPGEFVYFAGHPVTPNPANAASSARMKPCTRSPAFACSWSGSAPWATFCTRCRR